MRARATNRSEIGMACPLLRMPSVRLSSSRKICTGQLPLEPTKKRREKSMASNTNIDVSGSHRSADLIGLVGHCCEPPFTPNHGWSSGSMCPAAIPTGAGFEPSRRVRRKLVPSLGRCSPKGGAGPQPTPGEQANRRPPIHVATKRHQNSRCRAEISRAPIGARTSATTRNIFGPFCGKTAVAKLLVAAPPR